MGGDEVSVRVSVILERKGREVATVAATATLLDAAHALAEHDIGALVVSEDGHTVDGIISERDLVRQCARSGPGCWDRPVREAMTAEVRTCDPSATADDLMATMTELRIRHVPVVVDGGLVGIVSIGDVVKTRLDDLELQAEALEQYVTGSTR
ncbi:CBS domain-containing protein [soil metagenome]